MKVSSIGLGVKSTLVLSAVLLLTACGSTRIFYATFESDAVGSLPNENPPEDPPGDLIWTSAGSSPGTLSVVENAAASGLRSDGNRQSLRYRNTNIPLYNRFVGFFAREVSLAPDKTFYAAWNGHIDLDDSGSGLQIWLGNSHFLPIALLEFKAGNIRLQRSSESEPDFEVVGPYTERGAHTIVMTVNKASRTYSLSILQPGTSPIAVGARPILNEVAVNTQRPTLYMNFHENASGSGRYEIDNVYISEKEPEMPGG